MTPTDPQGAGETRETLAMLDEHYARYADSAKEYPVDVPKAAAWKYAAECVREVAALRRQVEALTSDCERVIEEAYREGYEDADSDPYNASKTRITEAWEKSEARAALAAYAQARAAQSPTPEQPDE